MSDLVIAERDGWVELELGSVYGIDWYQLWGSIGQGDDDGARDALEASEVFFTKPGTDGEEMFDGKLEFVAVALPDDMMGEARRVWVKTDAPFEVWISTDERLQEA